MACYWAGMFQPPHLAAIAPYEGLTDMYGETWRSEGPWPVFDRTRDLSKLKVPILSAGNWMDSEVHFPGNLAAFERSSSRWKFLEIHTGNHIASYYEPAQTERQLRFFDYFLKGKTDNGLEATPRIDLLIRRGTNNSYRVEESWPPQDTIYTSLYLAPDEALSFDEFAASSEDDAISSAGLTGKDLFQSAPLKDFEILGYPNLDLAVSTDAKDMDIFIYFCHRLD